MVALSKYEQFSARLNKLLDENGAPVKNLGRTKWFHDLLKSRMKIHVSYESARKWLTGEAIPYTKRIGIIARGLNSTTEYLIGESTETNISVINKVMEPVAPYSRDDENLLNRIHKLSPADQARLNKIIDALNSVVDRDTK